MTRAERDKQPISHRTSMPPGLCSVMTGFFQAQGCTVADEGCLLTRMPFDSELSPIPHRACVAADWARVMINGILQRAGLNSLANWAQRLPVIVDGLTALEVSEELHDKVLAEVNVALLARAIESGPTYETVLIAATVVQHAIDAALLASRVWSIGDDVERSHAAEDLGHAVGKVALHVNEVAQLEFLELMRNL